MRQQPHLSVPTSWASRPVDFNAQRPVGAAGAEILYQHQARNCKGNCYVELNQI